MSAFVTETLYSAEDGAIIGFWMEYDIEYNEEWACAIGYCFCNLTGKLENIETRIYEEGKWFESCHKWVL